MLNQAEPAPVRTTVGSLAIACGAAESAKYRHCRGEAPDWIAFHGRPLARPHCMKKSELPSTLKRSPRKAQRTFIKTHDSAVEEYGEGERARRTAYASLKHSFEKVGDHWESKDQKGPSDIEGRSSMSKKELARAIARQQD